MSGYFISTLVADCLRAVAMTARSLPAIGVLWFAAGPSAAAEQANLKIGGTGTTLSTMRLLGATFEKTNPDITVTVLSSLGSTGGIKAAIAGAIDIGVSARALTNAERAQGGREVEYARAPLVFAVAQAIRASEVTTAQLVDIYTGKLTAWPGGDPIRVVMRPESDINTIILKNSSAQMKEALTLAEKRPGMLFALTDQEAADFLEKVPGALTATSLSEIVSSAPRLKALTLNGAAPSPAAIADGSYPLSYSFYLVTVKAPGALAAQFIGFVQSQQGREILADTGHSPPKP